MKDFPEVFARLRDTLRPYAESLDCKVDSDEQLSLDTRHIQKNKQPLWFGGVQIKKRYVSYHLMPVYVNPDLLADLSPELRKRMQGKSCFNFTTVDEGLFSELADLTEAAFADYRRQGFV
ncbi:MAG: hypothetical protein V2J10_01000 [Wenzhouxiangella sp.]|jgi:hypothetical protein|nr:hypothetical protein [Wenzhouxiangella sp.]